MKLKRLGALAFSTMVIVSSVMPLVGEAATDYPDTADSKAKVNFMPAGEEPTPVDPTDPNNPTPLEPDDPKNPVHPGTTGALRFDRVPVLDFGKIIIKGETVAIPVKDDDYRYSGSTTTDFYAAPTVQVTDVRGSNKGWTASVKATTFEAYDKDGVVVADSALEKAFITFNDAKLGSLSGVEEKYQPVMKPGVKLNTASQIFVGAEDGKGMGKWGVSFADDANSENGYPIKHTEAGAENKAITLTVAATDKKLQDYTYKSTLTWSISDEPSK